MKLTPMSSNNICGTRSRVKTKGMSFYLVGVCLFLFTFSAFAVSGLKPDEILIIANSSDPASLRIAGSYCEKRNVPEDNIFTLSLPAPLADSISRANYEKLIAHPIRAELSKPHRAGKIKCLLTVYGIPYKVGPEEALEIDKPKIAELTALTEIKTNRLKQIVGELEELAGPKRSGQNRFDNNLSGKKLLKKINSYIKETSSKIRAITNESVRQESTRQWLGFYTEINGRGKPLQSAIERSGLSYELPNAEMVEFAKSIKLLKQADSEQWEFDKRMGESFYEKLEFVSGINGLLLRLEADTDSFEGIGTDASLDSELSMVMFDDYPLYREQSNELNKRILWIGVKTLMVSRLDGPSEDIAIGLIDKAITAERNGLKGTAYIDSGYSYTKRGSSLYKKIDESLLQTASMLQKRTDFRVTQETTAKLFAPGDCPETAIYCGWYSLQKYIDAFDFVDGAIGFHIASFEAIDLRDADSRQWCPAMLRDGVTVTMGAVAEPYLAAFPEPKKFFSELLKGKTLVEAYYKTKPFNSWRMILISDPLYRPFQ